MHLVRALELVLLQAKSVAITDLEPKAWAHPPVITVNNSQVCGKQLTLVTANLVWAQNKNVVTNTAPFSFAALTALAVVNSVGDYQL